MKKLSGILFAALIFAAPLAMYAEIESTAGSMKVGVHMDISYRWSGESNKDAAEPGHEDEIGWLGYDTFSAGDIMIEITGKIGDRLTYKILQGLVYGDFVMMSPTLEGEMGGLPKMPWGPGDSGVIMAMPKTNPTMDVFIQPMEAYSDFKVIDQLKVRFGRSVIPTLLANTGVHRANVIHTANPPLIANRVFGFNEMLVNMALTSPTGPEGSPGGFFRVPLPLNVTGAGFIVTPLEGVELEYKAYNEWFNGGAGNLLGLLKVIETTGDLAFDYNRTKGWDLALTLAHDLGPGKLTVRGFYFDEYIDLHNLNFTATPIQSPLNGRNFGWGAGLNYDAKKFFFGGEYATDTLTWSEKPDGFDKKGNTWSGFYAQVGGRFGDIQPVYRYDFIDYTSLKNNDIEYEDIDIESFDTETWHTFGINYLANDHTTAGIDYVIKKPEEMKDVKYPNINEIIVMMELDLL